MRTAFLLGAGLGTRLRPLTELRPKPLIPVFNKPLAEFAFDHLIVAGFDRFIVNTHHCPHVWQEVFGGNGLETSYRNCEVHFRYEPVLLETGGGLKNIEVLAGEAPLLIYNGDILTDMPIEKLIRHHRESGNLVTLALRSSGGPLQVQCDMQTGRVQDIRQVLGGSNAPFFLFTGVYVISPEIFSWIPPQTITSIIPIFLSMLQAGKAIGGVVLDEGLWMDLGARDAYLAAHRILQQQEFRLDYSFAKPLASVPDGFLLSPNYKGFYSIGDGCKIAENVCLEDTVLWDGCEIAANTRLQACVVRERRKIAGTHQNLDI